MPVKIATTHRSNCEIAREALAKANQAPEVDKDTLLILGLGIGYALLDIADAFRDQNYLLCTIQKEISHGG